MKKIAENIIRFRTIILITIAVITVGLGYFMKDLKVNPDVLSYLPKNDDQATLFEDIGKKYGGNQTAIIGVQADDIFNYDVLSEIKTITDSLKMLDGISTALSITDVIDIRDVDGILEIGKLIDEYNIPQSKEELDSIRNYTLSKDLYTGSLISKDCKMTMIAVKLKEGAEKMEVAKKIKEKIKEINPAVKVYFGGMPFMLLDLGTIIMDDISVLGPIALFLIILILLLSFRTFRGVFIPVVTVIIAIIWSLGLMGLLHYEITLVTNITPVILLAVGSAYAIHVINRYYEIPEPENKTRVSNTLAYIIVPVFFASITTVVGFLSFIFGSYLTMISTFGLFTAIGVFFSLLLSLTFAPAVLSFGKSPKNKIEQKTDSVQRTSLLNNFLQKISNLVFRHPKYIFSFWMLIVLVAIIGMFRIERRVDLMDYYKEGSDARVTENLLREKFGGTLPVYINVKGNIQSSEVLKAMEKTAEFLKSQPIITNTQSVADLISEMNDLMGEGKRIPDEDDKIGNLWFLLDGQDIMSQLVTPDLTEALIQGTVSSSDMVELNVLIDNINKFLKENHYDKYQMSFTGFPSFYRKLDESLLNSQTQSLSIAIILVIIAISFLLKSFIKGLYATIPIVVTLIILFGVMGISGIPLDVATVLVGSISIGIGIDYAIHMVTHLNHEQKQKGDLSQIIRNCITISGKAIVINVISVTLGFLVLLFSDIVPLQRFGILVAVTMVASGLSTITLLPSIILLSKKTFKNKENEN